MGNKLCSYTTEEASRSEQDLHSIIKSAKDLSLIIQIGNELTTSGGDDICSIAKQNCKLHHENPIGVTPKNVDFGKKEGLCNELTRQKRKKQKNTRNNKPMFTTTETLVSNEEKASFQGTGKNVRKFTIRLSTEELNANIDDEYGAKSKISMSEVMPLNIEKVVKGGSSKKTFMEWTKDSKLGSDSSMWLKDSKLESDSKMRLKDNKLENDSKTRLKASNLGNDSKTRFKDSKLRSDSSMWLNDSKLGSDSKTRLKNSKLESDSKTQLKTTTSSPMKSKPALNKSVLLSTSEPPTTKPFRYPNPWDHVYLKGDLLKYHPGFSSPYIKKYCKVTKKYFLYCEPQCRFDSNCVFAKIDYQDIDSVKRVHVSSTMDEHVKQGYQFEIFMKPGWSLKYTSMAKYYVPVSVSPKKKNRNAFKCAVRSVSSGHLLTRPKSLCRRNCSPISSPSINAKAQEQYKKPIRVDRVEFETKKEVLAYIEFVKKHGVDLARIAKRERIEPKSPTRWIKGIKGHQTWNNREIEWYVAEERLLFTTRSIDECERWVWLLNWLHLNSKDI